MTATLNNVAEKADEQSAEGNAEGGAAQRHEGPHPGVDQLRALLVTAADDVRARLRDFSQRELLATCAAFRIGADDDSLAVVTRFALGELAQRALFLASGSSK